LVLLGLLGCLPALSANSIFVYPRFDCMYYDSVGTARARFGYTNLGNGTVNIPKGTANEFIQDPSFRNQPTAFDAGSYSNVFETDFDTSVGLNWVLNGTFATAVTTAPFVGCPAVGPGGLIARQFSPV